MEGGRLTVCLVVVGAFVLNALGEVLEVLRRDETPITTPRQSWSW
ncbi:hypothetical protein ACFV98_36000 [Streptomyces violascens]